MAVINLPYKPIHSINWIEKHLSKNYYKKKYDRFMWWRSYTPKNAPLPARNYTVRDRILNGDFELGPFVYEIELAEHRMNEKWIKHRGYEDTYREDIQVDKARRKRLMEDRDKDEFNKLADLKRSMVFEVKMTKEQYEKEVTNYTGPDLVNFYYRMADKYGVYARKPKAIPNFR
jgi:hypothetical protein